MLSFFISGKNSELSLSKRQIGHINLFNKLVCDILLLPVKMMLDEVKSRTAARL